MSHATHIQYIVYKLASFSGLLKIDFEGEQEKNKAVQYRKLRE